MIQAAKRAAGSRVPLPEVPATSEPLPVPTDAVTLSGPPAYWQEACADLMKRDRILRKIIPAFGPAHLASRGDPFVTLARSIVGQQISVKAAQSVWERLVEACPKLVPAQFLRAGHEKLAGCGLSKRKAEYILDLAEHFRNGTVHVAKWVEMDDEDVIAELTQIRGIGRWTAEMFLMFNLLRPNVLPLDDIGLINAISQNYFSGEPVTAARRARSPPTGSRGARWPRGTCGAASTRPPPIDLSIPMKRGVSAAGQNPVECAPSRAFRGIHENNLPGVRAADR